MYSATSRASAKDGKWREIIVRMFSKIFMFVVLGIFISEIAFAFRITSLEEFLSTKNFEAENQVIQVTEVAVSKVYYYQYGEWHEEGFLSYTLVANTNSDFLDYINKGYLNPRIKLMGRDRGGKAFDLDFTESDDKTIQDFLSLNKMPIEVPVNAKIDRVKIVALNDEDARRTLTTTRTLATEGVVETTGVPFVNVGVEDSIEKGISPGDWKVINKIGQIKYYVKKDSGGFWTIVNMKAPEVKTILLGQEEYAYTGTPGKGDFKVYIMNRGVGEELGSEDQDVIEAVKTEIQSQAHAISAATPPPISSSTQPAPETPAPTSFTFPVTLAN